LRSIRTKENNIRADIRREVMLPRWLSFLRPAILAAALVLSLSVVHNGHGQAPTQGGQGAGYGWGGTNAPNTNLANAGQASAGTGTSSITSSGGNVPEFFEVVCPGGCYGGAFHLFGRRAYAGGGYGGFFRRYWGYGFYGPNYNMGLVDSHCGVNGFVYVATHRGHGHSKHGGEDLPVAACDLGGVPPGAGIKPSTLPASEPARSPAEKLPAPTPNRAHLQLLVPEKAEVRVEGVKTSKTGTVRDFVSPPLTPGKNMTYTIAVRYTDASGKPVEETHSVRVRANDRLRIDCTKPANAEPVRAAALQP
jgi:uncharacterized protein (TIGR03000 family)